MALLESVILRGTRASQPAATAVAVGTLYCVTDEGTIVERSNGSGWEAYGANGTGDGDVVGPAGAVTADIVVFSGATGKLVADGGQTIAQVIAAGAAAAPQGDVVGPAGAVADHLAVFDGATGKLIKDGGVVPAVDPNTVTADAVIDDHALVRGEDGARGVQDSGVTLDDSDNLAGVASLAVATALVTNTVATFGGTILSPLVDDGNSGTSKDIDWSLGNDHILTLTGSVVLTFSKPVNGGRYVLLLNTGAGSFTVTWPGTVRWVDAPTVTATAGKLDLFTFIYVSSLNLYFGAYNQGYAAS